MSTSLANQYLKTNSTNSTAASFASKVPTATEPTGTGIIELESTTKGMARDWVQLIPFGTDATNETFKLRILGWSSTSQGTGKLWVPVVLGEATCTLGTAVGVAAKDVLNTEYFADTIVLATTSGDVEGVSLSVFSPADNTIGHILLDSKGHQKIEVQFDMNSSATNANCLYRVM